MVLSHKSPTCPKHPYNWIRQLLGRCGDKDSQSLASDRRMFKVTSRRPTGEHLEVKNQE